MQHATSHAPQLAAGPAPGPARGRDGASGATHAAGATESALLAQKQSQKRDRAILPQY